MSCQRVKSGTYELTLPSRTPFLKSLGQILSRNQDLWQIKRAHKSLFSSGALMKVQKLFKPYTELRMWDHHCSNKRYGRFYLTQSTIWCSFWVQSLFTKSSTLQFSIQTWSSLCLFWLCRLESYLKIKILYFTWLNKKKKGSKSLFGSKKPFVCCILFLFAAVAKICSEISAMYKNVTQLYIFIQFWFATFVV